MYKMPDWTIEYNDSLHCDKSDIMTFNNNTMLIQKKTRISKKNLEISNAKQILCPDPMRTKI